MLFWDKDGQLRFTLHYPNDKYMERPQLMNVEYLNGELILENE